VNPDLPTQHLSGVAGPAEQQARYFQLMKQGWNNNDACRAVGICRKTGTRWRLGRTETKNGHTHSYPALEPVGTTGISKRFLSEQERVRIADLHRVGNSMRSIVAELGRAVSTISRELQRNLDPAQWRIPAAHREPARGDPSRPAQNDQDRGRSSAAGVRRRPPG
jgi:IS30 family transposase